MHPPAVSLEEYETVLNCGGIIALPGSSLLRLTGPDRIRYLNGQVTNDVRKLTPGQALWAGICSHKGKLEALVAISSQDAQLAVSGCSALRDFLPLRLEKYLIADDAVLTDVSNNLTLCHVISESPPVPGAVRLNRYGMAGWDVWASPEAASDLLGRHRIISPASAELLRIEAGRPAWPEELDAGILPQEAGLDEFAIDFHKGCYIGQEVVSRLRSVGRVNKHLQKLWIDVPAKPGWRLYATGGGGLEDVGWITSAAWHPKLQKSVALGYVRRENSESSVRLLSGSDPDQLSATVGFRNA